MEEKEMGHREVKRALARTRLEEDRKQLEDELGKPDPFATWPKVVLQDYLLKHLDTASRINLCKASRWVKKVWGTKDATWTLAQAVTAVPKLYYTLAHNDGNGMFRIRAVCRDWNFAVDNCYDTLDSHLLRPTYSDHRALLTPLFQGHTGHHFRYEGKWTDWWPMQHGYRLGYAFYTTARRHRLDRFLEHSRGGHFPNSIVTKAICVVIEGGDEDTIFIVRALLDECGSQLRYAEFCFRTEEHAHQDLEVVSDCLRRTPRLTTLILRSCCDYNSWKVTPVEVELPPLPELVNLRIPTSSYSSVRRKAAPLLNSLSVYFGQLHTLELENSPLMELYNPERHSTFPNLFRVSLTVNSLEQLLKLRSWTSPLKEIKINSVQISLQVHLHALESFWPTLTAIKIHAMGHHEQVLTLEGLGLPVPPSFNLPEMAILSYVVGCGEPYLASLNGLHHLSRSPQHLEMGNVLGHCNCRTIPDMQMQQEEENWRLWDVSDLYDSTIWERLPNVQQILHKKKESTKFYTRKEFLARQGILRM